MLTLMLAAALQVAEQSSDASIVGTVRDATSGHPLARALVAAVDLGVRTQSDAQGRYHLESLPPGPLRVSVRLIGYAPFTLHAVVPREGTLALDLILQRLPEPLPIVEVRRSRPDVARLADGDGRALNAASLLRHPQLAEPDFMKAMAGGDVSIAPETPGGLHVRGASADQTGYTIDDVPVFNPYHVSDLMGAWNTDALDAAQLTTTVDGAAQLGGSLRLATRTIGDTWTSRAGLSTSHGRFSADGPLGVGDARFLLSGRIAWPAFLAPAYDANYVRGESVDWMAKVEVPLAGGVARGLVTQGNDGITMAALSPDERRNSLVDARNAFDWAHRAASLQWHGRWRGDSLAFTSWRSVAEASGSWGLSPSSLQSRRVDNGVQLALARRARDAVRRVGVRAEHSNTRYSAGDAALSGISLGSASPLLTLFADESRALGAHVGVTLGAAGQLYRGRGYLSPRVRALWSPLDRVTFSATLGRGHQFAQSLRNTESPIGYVFPADLFIGAGNETIPVARSDEATVTLDVVAARGARARVAGYVRRSTGLLMVAPVEEGPFLQHPPEAGASTARGGYVEARADSARYGVLLRYGLQRVEFQHGARRYVPEWGSRSLLDGGFTVFPTTSTTIRVGVNAAFGRYVTPAVGGLEWESCNLKDAGCEFAGTPRADSSRLGAFRPPPYVRVDVGLRKHGRLRVGGQSVELAAFATVSNLFDRYNVLTYAVNGESRVPLQMRPFSPFVVGIDWRF